MTYLTPEMRWFLLGGSILVFLFMMHFIRKSRVRIEDTMFWIIMCVGLIIISVFPQIPFWFARILKVESPCYDSNTAGKPVLYDTENFPHAD